MRKSRIGVFAAGAVLILAGGGSAGLPQHVKKFPSEACESRTTTLGRIVEHCDAAHNLSGIRLLTSGDEALASLIALADHAERTSTFSTTSSCRTIPRAVAASRAPRGGSRSAGAAAGR
jgi:hypothetical protein